MIPRSSDLGSDVIRHRFGDLFNPPGLTNFVGCVQADLDLTGMRGLSFPPLASGSEATAGLFVDGRYFPSTGAAISFKWFPDRLERWATWDGLKLRSVTFLPPGRRACIVRLDVQNVGGAARTVDLRFAFRGQVTRRVGRWDEPLPPGEDDNVVSVDEGRRAIGFRAKWSSAFGLNGTFPAADHLDARGLGVSLELEAGERRSVFVVNAMGESVGEVRQTYDDLISRGAAELDRTRREWDAEMSAVFTPDNDRYSGSLPVLETSDPSLRRLYDMGVLGVVYFKREAPNSGIGRAYDTLMPMYWQTVTFLWDYHLSGLVHAMLDPAVMRSYLERWMATDIHTHFGTEWLTGAPVGCWYAVNDYAMTRLIWDYLRFTGDIGWLDQEVPSLDGHSRRVHGYLDEYVTSWESLRTRSGLADYGRLVNLLECVSTYVNEVAGLNAANVWSLRRAADIFAYVGEMEKAEGYDYVAALLSKDVMQLYMPGTGHWGSRRPSGEVVAVRHAYDFVTVLDTIASDLTEAQRAEMTSFFRTDLHAQTWMHALSCRDPEAVFSVRPDHQWTGAYTAWPAQAIKGLYGIGMHELAAEWLHGLARSANQGPFGQAHFAGGVVRPEAGGALKAPSHMPWICDWACSSGGAWVSAIIEGVFGVQATLDGLTANPQLGGLDPEARLVHVPYQGRLYTVDASGVRPED